MAKGYFDKKPKTTYGVEFEFKTVPLPNSNQRVRAQMWDTSGAKQFLSITTTHYRFAVGAFLVYDITNLQSFQNLSGWLDKIRSYSDDNVKIALIANKKDLVDSSEQ
jgi:small GTP-binding protein